eukprot:1456588-Pleurochrysis_carterae.AAC.3
MTGAAGLLAGTEPRASFSEENGTKVPEARLKRRVGGEGRTGARKVQRTGVCARRWRGGGAGVQLSA